MKRALLLLLILLPVASSAQRSGVFDEIRADRNKSAGVDGLYPMKAPGLTPAPKGYQAFYISHYGRHGSRYAFSDKIFKETMAVLEEGRNMDNLTPFGQRLLDSLLSAWPRMQYRIGDLTPLGWEQHQFIGKTMVASFPSVFGKGSVVDATASFKVRCILSMVSCCQAISKAAPQCSVYEHQSILDIPATIPHATENIFQYKGPEQPLPFPYTRDEYLERRFPAYKNVLGRLFRNPSAAIEGRSPFMVIYYLYLIQEGKRSLPEEMQMQLDGPMTEEETCAFWEIANYHQFSAFFKTRTACCAIVDDILRKAEDRIWSTIPGADLRFGHDQSLLATLMVMDIDGMGTIPSKAEELPLWFQNFRSPMGANLQFVFFRPGKGRKGEILVKAILNGEEVAVGNLPAVDGPYYRWKDLADYLRSRTELFISR